MRPGDDQVDAMPLRIPGYLYLRAQLSPSHRFPSLLPNAIAGYVPARPGARCTPKSPAKPHLRMGARSRVRPPHGTG
jgi:hypothetical protein